MREFLYGIVLFEEGGIHRAHHQVLQTLFTVKGLSGLAQTASRCVLAEVKPAKRSFSFK